MPTPFDPFAPITTQTMQTKLFTSPFVQPPGCEPCRTESTVRIKIAGKLYNFTFRDKITPEDPYLVGIKAAAFAIARTEEFRGTPPARNVRDFLVRNNIVIG